VPRWPAPRRHAVILADRGSGGSPGILISLDALITQRADDPTALDEAPVALRRIGWIGRPIVLVGKRVAGRDLPLDAKDREAWVRTSIGRGAYAVVPFEDPSEGRGDIEDAAIEECRTLREAQRGTWLLTDRPRQVDAARAAGLKVIVIGPADPQPRLRRPEYQARDLRDAVGHLLTVDVFARPSTDHVAASNGG
jgi:hypothetical protein